MAAVFEKLLRNERRGVAIHRLCNGLCWATSIAAFLVCGFAYGASSTVGVSIGLGLLALAPAFYALKRIVAAHLPGDHELHRQFSLAMMLFALAIEIALATILLIDPWILEPLYAVMLYFLENMGE